jgi:hypothetical protein
MQDEDLLEDDFRLSRPVLALIVLLLISVFSGFCIQSLIKKQAKMDINTIFVNQPELGIEKARFYLIKNWLGYGLVQFKDVNDDKKLDKVFYSNSEIAFNPDAFNPDTGFPGKDVLVSDPNSSDWSEWLKRFDLVLKEQAEKLKQQEKLKRRTK